MGVLQTIAELFFVVSENILLGPCHGLSTTSTTRHRQIVLLPETLEENQGQVRKWHSKLLKSDPDLGIQIDLGSSEKRAKNSGADGVEGEIKFHSEAGRYLIGGGA